jgi:hypothetical protein
VNTALKVLGGVALGVIGTYVGFWGWVVYKFHGPQ